LIRAAASTQPLGELSTFANGGIAMSEDDQYDLKELERLWNLNYKELAMAPGLPNGRLKGPRFILQARVALETRRLAFVMTLATIAMTLATIAMAIEAFAHR
jgi:hypothetical protein